MKTPTHLLIGHGLAACLPGSNRHKTTWVALGAGLPDFPLLLVGLSCLVQSGVFCGWPLWADYFVVLMDNHYFGDPVFISMHHILHSPTSLVILAGVLLCARRFLGFGDMRALWFLAGAASHALVDIFTHARDGILVFWPFDWHYRFDSGLHQWDMQGTGLWLAAFEATLVMAYGGIVAWRTVSPFVNFMRFPHRREPLAG